MLTHNSMLGRAHPDLVVGNAFGDRYPYALCPAAPDVQEYCLTLVEEVLRSAPLDGVVLEACGPMGLDHAGKHEKTEFAGWDEAARALLSLCFCQACADRYAAAGVDSGRLAQVVREGVEEGSGTVEDRLGDGLAAEVAASRTGIARQLELVARCRSVDPSIRIMVHGSSDPWATGSFATVQPALGEGVDGVVASCWDLPREAGASRTCAPWPAQAPRWAPTSAGPWLARGRDDRPPPPGLPAVGHDRAAPVPPRAARPPGHCDHAPRHRDDQRAGSTGIASTATTAPEAKQAVTDSFVPSGAVATRRRRRCRPGTPPADLTVAPRREHGLDDAPALHGGVAAHRQGRVALEHASEHLAVGW